jgi:hypothetical protein
MSNGLCKIWLTEIFQEFVQPNFAETLIVVRLLAIQRSTFTTFFVNKKGGIKWTTKSVFFSTAEFHQQTKITCFPFRNYHQR